MRRVCLLLTISVLAFSCKSFETEEYLTEENKALLDLIPEMVEAEHLLTHNDFETSKPILYIIDELENTLELTKYDSISEQDKRGLSPLTKSQMKKRKLSKELTKQFIGFEARLLTIEEYNVNHEGFLIENINKGATFGYLSISRIAFNDDYEIGYVAFDFFCGEGCAWNSVIEIKKVDGHWTKGKIIYGGMA